MDYRIIPPEGFFEARVELPLSKSMSARQMVIDAMAGAELQFPVAQCDDTAALARGLSVHQGVVNARLAGTALRFLTAYYAATPGTEVVLTGEERLCQRPIALLVDALRTLGADIEYIDNEGFAPLKISGKQLRGGRVEIPAGTSSQFISALMLMSPAMSEPLEIQMLGEAVSVPYIRMTAEIMTRRGVEVDFDPRANLITVANGKYNGASTAIEVDWSAASYWYMLTALTAGITLLPGAQLPSLQGDSTVADVFQRLGVLTGPDENEPEILALTASPEVYSSLDLDLSGTPDLAQTYAVTAALLGIPFRLTGLSTLRVKETDRIAALVTELDKIGIVAEADGTDVLAWDGTRHPVAELPVFDTYNDHRMAMALAGVSVYIPGIVIRDAQVVSKSYPQFWEHLRQAGFTLLDPSETPAP